MTNVKPSTHRSVSSHDRYADLDRDDGVARERPGSILWHSRDSAVGGSGFVEGHRQRGTMTDMRALAVATAPTRAWTRSVAR